MSTSTTTPAASTAPGARLTAPVHRAATALSLFVLCAVAFLRGDEPADDRGSETTEKAFMIILAISLGTAVTIAAAAYVASKTALFRG